MAVLFPTAYFGRIAYFQEIMRNRSVSIEVWDTFPKQTFRNRCVILGAQGPLRLTLPVEKPNGSKSLTNEILVVKSDEWRNNHWRAIKSAYSAAPYFDHSIELKLTSEFIPVSGSSSDFRGVDFESVDVDEFKSIHYTQVLFQESHFYANPSILDLLFCNGPLGRKQLLVR